MKFNQTSKIGKNIFIILLLITCLISCSGNGKKEISLDNILKKELTEGCIVEWDSITWELKYHFISNVDSLSIIKDLTKKLLDTTETEIKECYFYLNEDSVYQNLTYGQLSFWILWRELKIPIRDKFYMEFDAFGNNIKDSVFSNCYYPMYMMEWAHHKRQLIHDSIIKNSFIMSPYSPNYLKNKNGTR